MNVVAEISQVLRTDWIRTRWWYAGLAIAITFKIVSAIRFMSFSTPLAPLWFDPLLVVAAFLVAAVIQHEPPTGASAFWATVPIRARSVFLAKLISCVLIAIAAAVTKYMTLLLVADAPAFAGENFVRTFESTLGTIAFFALAAALTSNMLGYIFALIGLIVLQILLPMGAEYLGGNLVKFSAFVGSSVQLRIETALTLLLIFALYAARRSRLRAWPLAIALFLLLATAQAFIPDVIQAFTPPAAVRTDLLSTIQTSAISARVKEREVVVEFTAQLPARDVRVNIVNPVITVKPRGRASLKLKLASGNGLHYIFYGDTAERTDTQLVPVRPYSGSTYDASGALHVVLTFHQPDSLYQAVSTDSATVSFSGAIELQTPRTLVDLPTNVTDTVARGNLRYMMRTSTVENGKSVLTVQSRSLGVPGNPIASAFSPSQPRAIFYELHAQGYSVNPHRDGFDVMLVNSERTDTLLMQTFSRNGSSSGITLPTSTVSDARNELAPRDNVDELVLRKWLSGGRLVMREWSYAGHLSITGTATLR